MIGEQPFRKLDDRSWSVSRRTQDMDRDGVSLQVLSPMPELLSYWMDAADGELICHHSNHQIAEMIATAPNRFRGLGAVPLQDVGRAVALLPRLKPDFALSGVQIGSNINGVMLGDRRFDPFYEAAEALGLAIFVHALHPLAARSVEASQLYTALVLFPMDVAMAAASLIMAGTLERFPRLRIGFSHGGGALGAILGRLDTGWKTTSGFGADGPRRPSEVARSIFFDGNVYDPAYLHYVATQVAPGRVFAGTDYPYQIMQAEPADFIDAASLDASALAAVRYQAAEAFIGEPLT